MLMLLCMGLAWTEILSSRSLLDRHTEISLHELPQGRISGRFEVSTGRAGTKVHGDSIPRPILTFPPASPSTSVTGYALVGEAANTFNDTGPHYGSLRNDEKGVATEPAVI